MGGRYASLFFLSRFQAELDRLLQEAMEFTEDEVPVGEWQPSLDIVETASSILILVELPGFSAGELKVEARGQMIHLSGTKSTVLPDTEIKFHCMERSQGRFNREIQLLWPVNSHRGKACLTGGLLTIEFPKIQDKRQTARILRIEELPGESAETARGVR
jgi:HSP20 family molecular chaperone IbpA